MITFSSNVSAILQNPSISSFYTVRLSDNEDNINAPFWTSDVYALNSVRKSPLSNQTYKCILQGNSTLDPSLDSTRWTLSGYRSTSFYSNVTLSNGEVFVSDGAIISVSPPQLTSSVDRELFRVALADPNLLLGNLIGSTGLATKLLEVRFCFLDVNSQPLTDLQDTLLAYKGVVDSTGYTYSTENIGEIVLNISGSSPMADLDTTRNFYTSKEFVKTININDTTYDQIYEGSGVVRLKWGK